MSTARRISTLILLVGVLLPVASLGFVSGYNPAAGFLVFALGCFLVCLGAAGFWFSPNKPPEAPTNVDSESPPKDDSNNH